MKLVKRATALMLTIVMVFLSTSESVHALADAVTAPDTTTIQNDFIKVTVDNKTGRYGIRTVDGQPIRKNDDNVNLLFQGDDPETSFTTFRIDGTDYIYGNKYKFDNSHYSETTAPQVVTNADGTKQLEMVWKIKGVEIKQILMLYTDSKDAVNSGNVNIRYEVNNKSGAQVMVGSRILLDTMVGGNDGPQFQIGTAYKSPLQVERKLVHNPEADAAIPEEDRNYFKIPAYWVMRDKLDLTNPQATNVVAYGFNNFAEQNINIVDEMIVGHWNGLANTKWDYKVNPNLDFTRDTNDFGSADSAVAFYWNPDKIAPGGFQSFETVYGLGEIVAPDKVFSIRYLDTVQQLATELEPGETVPNKYVDNGVFDITAEIENLQAYNMEHSKIEVEMTLESGLSFVKQDEKGNDVLDASGNPVLENTRSKLLEFKKSATPEEAALGIQPKYKPGDAITATFRVQAKGRPWPTTRQYMLSARSPETQGKIQGIEDEGIKAQYESNKSNFILLPPVGEATPTYSYSLAPEELYSADVKYVTVNLSNLEAYNTGNETTQPNFDLYFKNVADDSRYKVDVQDAVVMQPTDDGFSGAMRITYRGGDLVDEGGNVIEADLGPELPLGEYQVEIDYKGDAGGDEEVAAMYDLSTPQTFLVTDNDESRIREAGIMVIYKELVDVSGVANGTSVSDDLLEQLNSLFPDEPFEDGDFLWSAVTEYKKTKALFGMASKAVDPDFELSEFMDDEALEETPLYNYKLFDSEEDFEAFQEEVEDEEADYEREILVTVRGMIKQVGSGADEQVIVDTKTEPAIINDAVAYTGKDLAFVRGKLEIFNANVPDDMPFLDTLFVKGDGTLSVASSGFVFHKGEWTLDFFNGFAKSLGDENYNIPKAETPEDEEEEEGEEEKGNDGNPEDDSLNGSLKWAIGGVGDRINPLRQVMIEDVYFNKQSLFGAPSFAIDGFGFSFNDFILREGGISFGGSLSLKVVTAEIQNVIFNNKGFYGVEASLGFDLNEDMGLFGPEEDKSDDEGPDAPSGEITINHVVQGSGEGNEYGLQFAAQLKNMLGVEIEFSLKKVADGRILPDVIGFGAELPSPGILVTGATYLTAVRGAVRELADTIAGGTDEDPFPLTVEAGVGMRFGIAPAYFFGDVDLTVKRTGLKIEGKLDFSADADAEEDDRLPMLTLALLEAQWVTPWFVRVATEVDIGGWDIIVGKAGIFVGQNLEKNRTDFEGYIGSKVQVPNDVPVVGGMPLSSVFFGVNNDKVWGSIGILLISLGITYYWNGGVEFGTSAEDLPEGMIHLVVDDPERGPRLMVIGSGVETLATSRVATEDENQEIIYREVAEGVKYVENGSMNVGATAITVKNGGRIHEIPMGGTTGNAIIEVEYDGKDMPKFTLQDAAGKNYPIKFDNTNTDPTANAFTQYVPASYVSPDKDKLNDEVDIRRAYVIVPEAQASKGGIWKLTAESAVETKLLNIPTLPQLNEVNLAKDSTNANKFNASWKVANAQEGDTVNLYLAEDAVTSKTTVIDGEEVLEPGDPGLLIAKDVPVDKNGNVSGGVTTGSTVIDVTNVTLMNSQEDIRGLLRQGNYYLRAELKSSATFGTKTSPQKFEIIDPLAPQEVSDVQVEPAGNGLFALSFKPGAKKAGHEDYEHSYVIDAKVATESGMEEYAPFGEILFTEEELQPYWNTGTGKYENLLIGGWKALSTSDEVNTESLEGTVIDVEKVKYTGLEVKREYSIGVSAATVPTEADDKNQNYHYAEAASSPKTLLPAISKPKLKISSSGKVEDTGNYINLLTNQTEQTLTISSEQKDITVEAFYAEKSIGKVALTNQTAGGSKGTLKLDQFQTDGPFAIELKARNMKTKDVSVTMLYLTVDTIAPVLYIDSPVTGDRTVLTNGQELIQVAGTTTAGTLLSAQYTVNGKTTSEPIQVQDNGAFSGTVAISSGDSTIALTLKAADEAGNENSAVVNITNNGFKAPVALIVKGPDVLEPGESGNVKAYFKYADGKDANGKTKFKEEPLTAEQLAKVTYTVAAGEDAVSLSSGGNISALSVGAGLIQAEYKLSDDITLEGMTATTVEVPEPVALGALKVTASPVTGDYQNTQITVTEYGDMTGQQLAYKVYASGAKLPAFQEDISSWELLPLNGIVDADIGNTIIVAKRTSTTKLATGAGQVAANIWVGGDSGAGTGGGGGGGGGALPAATEEPGQPAAITVNGQDVEANWNGRTAVLHITDKEYAAGSDLVIQSADAAAEGFSIAVDAAVIKQLQTAKKNFTLEVPMGTLVLAPENLSQVQSELQINIGLNSSSDQAAMNSIAAQQGFTALAAGQGVSVSGNLPEGSWSPALKLKAAIPSPIAADQITAIVLKDEAGHWTTVPWKLDASGKTVNVQLTGEGAVYFIRNDKSFKDVPAGWGQEAIDAASAKLFVLGKSAGIFDPSGQVTRAEYPTILLRTAGLMNKNAAAAGFTDVADASWYNLSVSIAAGLGIVTGMEDGRYAPQATLTRIEAMTMLGRLLAQLSSEYALTDAAAEGILAGFADQKQIPAWARQAVAASIKHGIILGENGKVNPAAPLTRVQAAAIAVRLDQLITD
ncbi:S-layer homology domain-containing protein [Paenibacillus tengchongensis]|uniref:S-layer homology domain-containing protein n=1 Tax=Paenibacillus tengchongensis TaxID=2608684 RepID=UPI00124D4F1A|nr:S-layer homology domain-containing protein [Paenibacillus tengchongensis]